MINEINLIKRFKKLQGVDTLANMFISDVIKIIKKEPKVDRWIPCSERMPEEHDSMFSDLKGTDKWDDAMFEKTSNDVNVTVEYENGKRRTKTLHTIDGKWNGGNRGVKFKVIAWQPLPEPYIETVGRAKT